MEDSPQPQRSQRSRCFSAPESSFSAPATLWPDHHTSEAWQVKLCTALGAPAAVDTVESAEARPQQPQQPEGHGS